MLNSLDLVHSGLNISKRAADTSTNNIANQGNDEYIRRSTDITEAAQIDERLTGRGVNLGETIRNTNDFIYQNFVGESTSLSYYDELANTLGTLESFFEETDESGFSKDLDEFFQVIEDLRTNPQNTSYKENLITQGKIVVDDLQALYQHLQSQEVNMVSSVKADIRDINRIVTDIANINEHLETTLVPQPTLIDKRDALEKELAQLVDITVTKDSDDYHLKIGTITAVRNDNAREFSYDESHIAQIDRFAQVDGFGNNISSFDGIMANANDKVIYELNDNMSVELTYGDAVYDANGTQLDLNGDGSVDALDVIDETNIVRALVLTINNDPQMSNVITAYNGNYTKDANGNPVADPDNTVERYLVIESNVPGSEGKFESNLLYLNDSDADNLYEVSTYDKNAKQSVDALSESFIKSYDERISISDGATKAKLENLDSSSSSNYIQMFKDKLNTFAQTLSDMTDKYLLNGDGSYIYGETAVYNSTEEYANKQSIQLFTGSSISTLSFNSTSINFMEQQDYDYLASLQYKSDILFNGGGQVSTTQTYDELSTDGSIGTSFSKFFQAFQTDIAYSKSNADFMYDTQQIVTQSLKSSYDKMVKVDPDEEMINLMKYQAAYEANAKLATVLQDMIQTTLDMVN